MRCDHLQTTEDTQEMTYNIGLPKTRATYHKEVFVKHEQAPTAPKLEGVWFFLQILNIFSMKTAIFGQFDNYRPGVLTKWSKGTSTDQDLTFEPSL